MTYMHMFLYVFVCLYVCKYTLVKQRTGMPNICHYTDLARGENMDILTNFAINNELVKEKFTFFKHNFYTAMDIDLAHFLSF